MDLERLAKVAGILEDCTLEESGQLVREAIVEIKNLRASLDTVKRAVEREREISKEIEVDRDKWSERAATAEKVLADRRVVVPELTKEERREICEELDARWSTGDNFERLVDRVFDLAQRKITNARALSHDEVERIERHAFHVGHSVGMENGGAMVRGMLHEVDEDEEFRLFKKTDALRQSTP